MNTSATTPDAGLRKEWRWLAGLWLALGLLAGWLLWLEHRHIEASDRQQLAHQARVVHDTLGRQFEAVSRALSSITADVLQLQGQPPPSQHQALERLDERLRVLQGVMFSVSALVVLDAEGTVIATSSGGLHGERLDHRRYFQAARGLAATAPHTLIVSPPLRTLLGTWGITMARPVRAQNGRFAGAVVATLDTEALRPVLDSGRYARDMVGVLVHGDGLLFLRSPADARAAAAPGADMARAGTLLEVPAGNESNNESNGAPQSAHAVRVALGVLEPGGPRRLVALSTFRPEGLHMDKPLVIGVGRDWGRMFAAWRAWALSLGAA